MERHDQAVSGSSMSSPSTPAFESSFASSSASLPRSSGDEVRRGSDMGAPALPEAARPARRLSLLSKCFVHL